MLAVSDIQRLELLLAIVTIGVAIAVRWSFRARSERIHRFAMALCACLGVWGFTFFGQMTDHGKFGHQNFHAHDFYHYYTGSKYLREWGYGDMYFASVAALEEIGKDDPKKAIQFERIRDLRGSARFMYRPEFLPLMSEARARFSPSRWSDLKRDLSFLRDKAPDNGWWRGVMLDNGFNPPPSYAIIGGAFSNTLPLNEATWKWLGALDFLLLGIGVGAMCFAIGPVAGLFTLVILGNSPITTYNWTGGSFLRQVWLFFLMIGLAFLARKKWARAGVFLGASSAIVVFPALFLIGALSPLAYRIVQKRSSAPFKRVAIGAFAAIATMVLASLLFYGASTWIQWQQRIGAHEVTFFDNHIGLKKLITFAPEVGNQAFRAGDFVYTDWTHALAWRAHRGHATDVLFGIFTSIIIIVATLRARAVEASLVIGSALLMLWTMPAGYYTIYVGVFAAFILANRSSKWARARFLVVGAALIGAIVFTIFERDLNTEMCGVSFGWMVTILVLSATYWIERPALAQDMGKRKRTAGLALLIAVALFLVGFVPRNAMHEGAFLPPELLRGGHIQDAFDLGPPDRNEAHQLAFAGNPWTWRKRIDTFGYRIKDDCGILKNGDALRYTLAASPNGGTLIVRTDGYFRGELRTIVNGHPVAAVTIEPHETMFIYLEIPIPSDIVADGSPLAIEQRTTAKDVGIFSVWMVEK